MFMKPGLFVLALLFSFRAVYGQFDEGFEHRSLRIDYVHAGNHQDEWFALDELLVEPYWGGSLTNLVDTFSYGQQKVEVSNPETGRLLYSRGYNSLFGEWQTTNEAQEISRSFTETVVVPFPLEPVKISLLSRNKSGEFISRFEMIIDPDDYFIKPIQRNRYPVAEIEVNAHPSKAVDIVLLPDGYTIQELDQFIADGQQFAESLFGFHPYDSLRSRFNIRAVLAPSVDSGIDIPADSVWKNTVLSSSFYIFDSERYCMTYDHKSVRDLASNAPYDQIYILTNTDKYGGGGIYNFYSLSSSKNRYAAAIMVHEFGHGFAGLGDEYYTSSTSYNDFYNLSIEPWEPNLTTLVNFDSKWKHLLDPDTPVPTPPDSIYMAKTGVFEGGGYVAKGIYRPAIDCLMHSFKDKRFCAACEEAIRNMVDFYSE
jgi:hypothetical protein